MTVAHRCHESRLLVGSDCCKVSRLHRLEHVLEVGGRVRVGNALLVGIAENPCAVSFDAVSYLLSATRLYLRSAAIMCW